MDKPGIPFEKIDKEKFNELFPPLPSMLIKEYYCQHQWISVEERLPREMERVLTICRCDDFYYYSIKYYANNIFSETLSECDRHNAFTLGKFVTHWMSLPLLPTNLSENK